MQKCKHCFSLHAQEEIQISKWSSTLQHKDVSLLHNYKLFSIIKAIVFTSINQWIVRITHWVPLLTCSVNDYVTHSDGMTFLGKEWFSWFIIFYLLIRYRPQPWGGDDLSTSWETLAESVFIGVTYWVAKSHWLFCDLLFWTPSGCRALTSKKINVTCWNDSRLSCETSHLCSHSCSLNFFSATFITKVMMTWCGWIKSYSDLYCA